MRTIQIFDDMAMMGDKVDIVKNTILA